MIGLIVGLILYLDVAFVIAVALWSILHSVLVRPFILVDVLRNYMAGGKEHLPSEADFKELDKYPDSANSAPRCERSPKR